MRQILYFLFRIVSDWPFSKNIYMVWKWNIRVVNLIPSIVSWSGALTVSYRKSSGDRKRRDVLKPSSKFVSCSFNRAQITQRKLVLSLSSARLKKCLFRLKYGYRIKVIILKSFLFGYRYFHYNTGTSQSQI